MFQTILANIANIFNTRCICEVAGLDYNATQGLKIM